jgi:ATP-dependent DNA helicase DinG
MTKTKEEINQPAVTTAVAIRKLHEVKEEARLGQARMAEAIEDTIQNTGQALLVQAGTGVGKSFGYLIPAILSKKKVVVSTGSISLQDQLAKKDLPFLQEFFSNFYNQTFSFSLLKGKGNFICLAKADEISKNPLEREDIIATIRGASRKIKKNDSISIADEVAKLIEFSDTSATGDKADINWESPNLDQLWSSFSTSNQDCPGASNCEFGSTCYAEEARDKAQSADVVVVNNHFYGLDIALYGKLIPRHDIVIFDEAHMISNAWSSIFGTSVSAESLNYAHKAYKKAMKSLASDSNDRNFFERVDLFKKKISSCSSSRRGIDQDIFEDQGLDDLFNSLIMDLGIFKDKLKKAKDSAKTPEDESKCNRSITMLTNRIEELSSIVNFIYKGSQDSLVWCSELAFNLTPIELKNFVADRWGLVTPIFCSASSQKADLKTVGLDQSGRYLEVESPFPYKENSILYVPGNLEPPPKIYGAPNQEQLELSYFKSTWAEMKRLIQASRGRALILFSTKKAMNSAYAHFSVIKDPKLPYNFYCQNGSFSNAELISIFTKDTSSVLFATKSFWQGVDVPGESCSLVVIDKIPFPHAQDPVSNQKRERLGRKAFDEFDIPSAVSDLLQGVGRLIRTKDDKGVVAVLDTRLADAKYGRDIYTKLPPMRLTRKFEVVKEFFAAEEQSNALRNDKSSDI